MPYDITYMWNLITRCTYLQKRNKLTDIMDLLPGWEGVNSEFEISKCKVVYIRVTESLCYKTESNTTL